MSDLRTSKAVSSTSWVEESTGSGKKSSLFNQIYLPLNIQGQGLCQTTNVLNHVNEVTQIKKFSPEEALVMAAVTKGRVPTGRHPPK
jgi:hypothetical protein